MCNVLGFWQKTACPLEFARRNRFVSDTAFGREKCHEWCCVGRVSERGRYALFGCNSRTL